MTATVPMTAPSLQQLAPNVAPKVKEGDLATAQMGLLGFGAVLIGIAWLTGGESFYASYLVGFMGALSICLGALFFTMIHHITRAGWSVNLRRLAENMAGALPFMLLLFIPVMVGWKEIYHHWADAVIVEGQPGYDAVLAGKSGWLNPVAFFVRVGVYFAIWIGLTTYFRNNSLRQDESGDPAISLRLSRVAAPGLLLFALSLTFAAFDWIMSIDPHWFSTIFGVTYFAGCFMAFCAFTILMGKWLASKGYLKDMITTEHYHDLGKYLFAFMIFWTYTNFSQYMLIWYANLPEETMWFQARANGGWGAIGTILVFGHFFIPFVYLLSRNVKRNPVGLSIGAAFLLIIHCFDMQFLILPSAAKHVEHAAEHAAEQHEGAASAIQSGLARFPSDLGTYASHIHWADFGCFVALLSMLAGLTLWNVRRTNLVPTRDPRLAESIHFLNF